MAANLPYLSTPGSIKTAFERVQSAATPERVTADFIQTKLSIKGGTGASIPAFLKKIGFVNSDGTPSELYKRFRNSSTSGGAVAEGMRVGYRELFEVNECCYELAEKDLLSLVCQVTGAAIGNAVAKLTVATFRNLRAYADFESRPKTDESSDAIATLQPNIRRTSSSDEKLGLNLSYTINLNLPATSDQAVFNAIFRSLREHLLNGE